MTFHIPPTVSIRCRDRACLLLPTTPSPFTIRLEGPQAFLAFSRLEEPYWVVPVPGRRSADIPPETQLLLWKNGPDYTCILPLVDPVSDLRASLRGTDHGVELVFDGTPSSPPSPDGIPAACIASHPDPYRARDLAFALARDTLRTFRLRTEKPLPRFVDLLGWCTWDAFYKDVTAEKVLEGLRSFRDRGVIPPLLILDDGWQATTGGFLDDFTTDPRKFPDGLAPLVQRTRKEFGVEIFGVWHHLLGYWAGVNPDSPLGRRFPVLPAGLVPGPWPKPMGQETLSLLDPAHAMAFYAEWYDTLRRNGVDMVKADGQSTLEIFTHGLRPRVGSMAAYQRAMQSAAATHFLGETLHCMSHGSDALLHMLSAVVLRNSNDYFPRASHTTQKEHIRRNGLNAFLHAAVGLPDWDMFQTHGPMADYHAAARAVSGGPVYVSDRPGQQDPAILRRLATPDGRILRCDRPALPCIDTLFVDHAHLPQPLKVHNRSGPCGVLGLFHCLHDRHPVRGDASASDIPDLEGDRFVLWSHNRRTCRIVHRDERFAVELADEAFELLTFAPKTGPLTALGLVDKYNPAPAVLHRLPSPDQSRLTVLMRSGGLAAFHTDRTPSEVLLDLRPAEDASYDAASGLLLLPLDGDGRVRRVDLAL